LYLRKDDPRHNPKSSKVMKEFSTSTASNLDKHQEYLGNLSTVNP